MWAILCGPFASFAQFAAKESSQKSKKHAISSTKWSNFAKPKQTRAKARVPGVGTLLGMRHARYLLSAGAKYSERPLSRRPCGARQPAGGPVRCHSAFRQA